MKTTTTNLNRNLIESVLPDGWKLYSIDSESFTVTCPLEDGLEMDRNIYKKNIKKIEKISNSEWDGSGCFIGSDLYENHFTFNAK